MVPDPQRGGPDLTFAGFLLVAALGALLWKSAPLESARPTGEDSGWYEEHVTEKIPARLWQDPFKAAYAYRERAKTVTEEPNAPHHDAAKGAPRPKVETVDMESFSDQLIQATKNSDADGPTVTILAVMVTLGSYPEMEERRRRRRYAVIAGLAESNYRPVDADFIGLWEPAKTLDGCSKPPPSDDRTGRWKISLRTQKISADRLLRRNTPSTQGQSFASSFDFIPYEWFTYENLATTPTSQGDRLNKVLVLWLNEADFELCPFEMLAHRIGSVLSPLDKPAKKNISLFLLGPARSSTLRKMVATSKSYAAEPGTSQRNGAQAAIKSLTCLGTHEIWILSSTATVDDSLLYGSDQDAAKQNFREFLKANDQCQPPRQSTPIQFRRTIHTDFELATQLAPELKSNWGIDCPEQVVLLSEWDTFFGRALPAAFDRAYSERCGIASQCSRGTAYRFYYFRGIDGLVASEPEEARKSDLSPTYPLEGDHNGLLSSFIRRPAGTGQFDYLRRFVEQIKSLDRKHRIGHKKPIKAIGLFGSDVYDKLLILRALRPWFPDKLFFTTDLDAHLLHPAEFRWTRNLLVASSFDLSLSDDSPSSQPGIDPIHIPRFRGAYQTSIFHATRIATDPAYRLRVPGLSSTPQLMRVGNGSGVSSFKAALLEKPYLFEIGRNTAVRLNDNDQDNWDDIVQKAALGIVFFLALLSIFVLHQMKPNAGWAVLGFLVFFVLLGAFSWFVVIEGRHLEPLSFSEGISIWPTEILRVFALLLSLLLFARIISDLRLNSKRIEAKYFAPRGHRWLPSMEPTLGEIFAPLLGIPLGPEQCKGKLPAQSRDSASSEPEEPSRPQGESRRKPLAIRQPVREAWWTWLPITIMFFIAVLWWMFTYSNRITLDSWWHLVLVWALIITIWFSILHRGFKIRSANAYFRYMNLATSRTKKYPGLREVWDTYQAYGSIRDCVLRATAYLIVYLAFADLLFYLFGPNFTPARGDASQFIHRMVLVSSLISVLLLLFLVVDTVRLGVYWIRSLYYHYDDRSPDKTTIQAISEELKVPDKYGKAWFTIELIAARTHEVSRLIYYPFIVVIIMILARSSYFDNWGLPWPVAIVVLINLCIAAVATIKLRQEAESARREILQNLRAELVQISGNGIPPNPKTVEAEKEQGTEPPVSGKGRDAKRKPKTQRAPRRATPDQLKALIELIEGLRTGAFRPLYHQPVVKAVVVLLGAIGLTASEYMSLFV
jgi:hypothetical protein